MPFSQGDRVRIVNHHPYNGASGTCMNDDVNGFVRVRVDGMGITKSITCSTPELTAEIADPQPDIVYGQECHDSELGLAFHQGQWCGGDRAANTGGALTLPAGTMAANFEESDGPATGATKEQVTSWLELGGSAGDAGAVQMSDGDGGFGDSGYEISGDHLYGPTNCRVGTNGTFVENRASALRFYGAGTWQGTWDASGIQLRSTSENVGIKLRAGATCIHSDADNQLDLRNGSNSQSFAAYGTYTDDSNYERLRMYGQAADNFVIATEAAGTGTVRDLTINGLAIEGSGAVIKSLSNATCKIDLGYAGNRVSIQSEDYLLLRAGGELHYLYASGAQSWSGPPTFAATLSTATGDEAMATINYTVNKSTSGDDRGLLINKTDTNSPGASYLLDLQVGGTSQFSVSDDGVVSVANLPTSDPAVADQLWNDSGTLKISAG